MSAFPVRHLAIVGATGAVGRECCAILDQRGFHADRVTLLASQRSAGAVINVGGADRTVEVLQPADFEGVDIAIFSAGAETSRRFAPIAVQAGAIVIDNSSAFRMDPTVPLVIPEINPGDLDGQRGIIAVPNCSAIIMLMAIAPIHGRFPIKRIVVSTYQSASGAGARAMHELIEQTRQHLNGESIRPVVFPHPIVFNLFCHNTVIGPDGYNGEERKMIDETRKILHAPDLSISPTCVRVPVLRAHSESINLEFDRAVAPDAVRELLCRAPGVRVVDDRVNNRFPMPIDATGRDDVLVGRIRQDASRPDGRGIDLFVSGDQLRKGAALNAVQIAEHIATGIRPRVSVAQ
ncbi:MAG: aspartate-semialdehyde dehydrogenase [Phycisphaerales bacterium]|nr:aspartate-semialdehyde dehydrogenase [Phycisphaerales bacterium]